MQPIPRSQVPFNPSLLKVSGPSLICLLLDTARVTFEGPADAPETIGAALRLPELGAHMRGLYGLR